MRVIFLGLSVFDQVGGIQRYSKDFLQALNDNEIDTISIVLHDFDKPYLKKFFGCNGSKLKFIYLLFKKIKSDDIVIWNHISVGIIYYFLRYIIPSKKNVIVIYGTEVWGENISRIKISALRSFRNIWSISDYTKDQVINAHFIDKHNIQILPCTINYQECGQEIKSPYQTNKINILTISRLNLEPKIKSIYRVMDVLPGLLEQGFDIHYTVVGSGSEYNNLIEYATRMGIQDNISLLGYVENTQPYLEHCDIFALVSEVEGFGIVFLEAMLFARCCVAAKNCGSDDVVLDGKTGFAIDLSRVGDLKNKLALLCSDVNLRNEMGKEGQRHFLQSFTYDIFRKQQLNLINEIYSDNRKSVKEHI